MLSKMWPLNFLILICFINLINALNKNDTQTLSTQTSNTFINQKNQPQINQFSQINQQNQFSQTNQQNQFNKQIILNNHKQYNKLTTQLNQIDQSTIKEISCNLNQTINFIRYSNRKLSLNFLNRLTEFTVNKLLNQTASFYSKSNVDKLRNNLNISIKITQICHDTCKNDLECLAFAINLKQSTCYLIKEDFRTNNKDHLLFDATNSWNFYEKVCFESTVHENSCNQIWSFDIHLNGMLNNPTNSLQKQSSSKISLEECLNICWTNSNGTLNFKCRSINYDIRKSLCTLNQHNRRIVPEAYVLAESTMDNMVYAENHCTPFQGKCVFRQIQAYYLPDYQVYDIETNVNSLDNCEQLCVNQSQYICRAFSYSKQLNQCKLSPEPSSSLINSISSTPNRRTNARRLEVLRPDKIQQQLIEKTNQQNSFAYYEKTSCINVKIDCDANGMHTKVDTDGPFTGRLFTANNFEKCSKSNVDTTLEQINITIPLDANECGSVATGNGTYSNKLILQYHPLILKESDRRISISCDYHLVKQKIRGSKRRILEGLLSSSQVITGLAESPPVRLSILNEDKEEVRGARLGDTLYFNVKLEDESVFGIFGSTLIAKSGNGNESLLLIDDHGCPLEPTIFPAVNVKSTDNSKSLSVPFQAFKFASDTIIKFQMTISFCLDSCAVITCDSLDLMKKRSLELTVNRKRRATDKEFKTGDIVTDVKMETNFFIISDDENNINSDSTLIADIKQPTQIGTNLLVKKNKNNHRHSQIIGNVESGYINYSQTNFNERVCFSPVFVYLFALLALIAQLLLMFFCTWILFNNIKRKSSIQTTRDLNSRQSQITTDIQSLYSLRTGNSTTLKNYYTPNQVDEGDLDYLNTVNTVGLNKWTKDFQLKSNKSTASKLYSSSNLVTMFNNRKINNFF